MFQEQFNQSLLTGIPVTLVLDNVVGDFLVSEIISDGTASAVVTSFSGTTLTAAYISGAFATDPITGATSGATADLVSATLGGSEAHLINGKKTVEFDVIGGAIAEVTITNGNYSFTEGMQLLIDGTISAKIAKILTQTNGVSAVLILQGISGGTPATSDTLTVVSSPNPSESNLSIEATISVYNDSPFFGIKVLVSNEELPPDITKPSTSGNSYSEVAYTDIATQSTYYSSASLYNPNGVYETKTFNVETNGAVWFFLVTTLDIPDEAAGTLTASLTAFSNYV